MMRWRTYPHAVWCDVHGTHHDRDRNPYDMIDENGPVNECGPDVWRNLAILSEENEDF